MIIMGNKWEIVLSEINRLGIFFIRRPPEEPKGPMLYLVLERSYPEKELSKNYVFEKNIIIRGQSFGEMG